MTVVPSPLVPPDSEGFRDDLWEPPAFFTHNWVEPTIVTTAWRTSTSSSRTTSEQRFGLVSKPYRTMRCRINGFSAGDLHRLRAVLIRMGKARTPFPLFSDQVDLNGKLSPSPSDFRYVGDFDYTRFQVGARVVAGVGGTSPQILDPHIIRTVVDVQPTHIELDGNLGETYSAPTVGSSSNQDPAIATTISSLDLDPLAISTTDTLVMFVGITGASVPNVNVATLGSENLQAAQRFNLVGSGSTMRLIGYATSFSTNQSGIIHLEFDGAGAASVGVAAYVVRGTHNVIPIHNWASNVQPNTVSGTVNITSAYPNQMVLSGHLRKTFNPDMVSSPGNMLAIQTLDDNAQLLTQNFDVVTPATHTMRINPIDVLDPTDWINGAFILNPIEQSGSTRGQIYPLIEAEIEFGGDIDLLTDRVGVSEIDVVETPGPSALDPIQTPGSLPAGFTTFAYDFGNGPVTLPVLDAPPNWQRIVVGQRRIGSRSDVGIGFTTDVYGPKPQAFISLPFRQMSRADCWKLMRFFDSRGGRLFPFWVIAPAAGIDPVSITGGTNEILTLNSGIEAIDWSFMSHLAVFDLISGAWTVHAITSNSESQITVSPGLHTTNLDQIDITTAHFCRFDTDTFIEQWITQRVQDLELPCVELLNEQDRLVVLEDLCLGGDPGPWVDGDGIAVCDSWCGDCGSGCCICEGCSVILECFTYRGECAEQIDCQGPCEPTGSNGVSLPFIECSEGLAHWGNGEGIDVFLNLATETWSVDIQPPANPCGEVDNLPSDNIGFCCCGPNIDCVDSIELHSCEAFTKKQPCTECFGNPCTYVITQRVVNGCHYPPGCCSPP